MLVLILLIAGALALLPSVVKQQASKYYAQAVPDGVLSIDDVGINLFTGKLLLKGVNATSKQHNVLKLGQFNAELSVRDLLSKNVHVQTLTLSDFDVLIERTGNQITIAGYTLPQAQPEKNASNAPFSLKSLGIEQLDIHHVALKNIRAKLKGQYIATDGVVRSLTIKNIHSNHTQAAKLKADIQLNTLALTPTAQNPITANLNQPVTLLIDTTIKKLFDKPDAKINAQLNLNALSLNVSEIDASINQATKLTIQATVSDALNNPSANFDVSLNAPNVRYEKNAQKINAGVGALKIKGTLKNILKQAALIADVDIQKLNWDVQLDDTQSFVGSSKAITVPKLSLTLGEENTREWLKDLPLSVLNFSNLNINQLKNKTTLPSLASDVTLNTLVVDGFDVLNPDANTRVKAELVVNALDYDLNQKDKHISLVPNAKLALQANIKNLKTPVVEADGQMNQIAVKATGFDEPLMRLENINLENVNFKNIKKPQINIQNINLNKLVLMGDRKPLLALASKLQGLALQNNQLIINDVALDNMSSNIIFAPKYKIVKVEKLLNYFSSPKSNTKQPPPQSEFKVVIKRIHTTGKNVVYIKDASLQPAIHHELFLKKVDVKNINTGHPNASTLFDVDVNIGKYSNVALAGDYTLLAKQPSGKFKGKLNNIDLLNYNTYLAQAIGYKAKTGALSMDVDVGVTKSELSGGVDVLLNNLELSPSDKGRIESLKKQLSMPLDQSLDLLKDKQGKIKINLPLKGNINAPDFSLSGVMTLVTKKALKTATMMGLKQMIQPYGSLLTIGEWAGDKLLAVKLDPIEYGYGETQVAKDKMPYLDKVVEIMRTKKALNLKLCAKISQEEADFAMLKPEELLPIANERSEHVRSYLIEKGGLSAGRILQCESEVSDKNKPYSWLDLEI